MKRLLSLLVVIAMVVSMVPSVFAAKEDVDFDELTGRLVVLEDIAEINVVLAEGSDGMIYQWTPDANYNLSLSYTAPEGTEIAVTVTQGEATATAADGAVSLDVWAEQVVEIEVSEAAALAAEFTISGEAWAVPGSDENNGIFLGQMENTVTAAGTTFSGNTTWYQGFFSGTVMTITGTGAYNVIYNGETIAAVDGVVSTAVASANPRNPVVFAIDTVGEYTISFAYPAGSQNNPAALVIGENTASIEAGNTQGYYYTWTAEKDGTLTITMPSDMGWTYVINNMTSYVYGDTQWSDMDPVANPATVEVAAGDELQIIVNTYDPADAWSNPDGDLVITAAFAEPVVEVPEITTEPADATAVFGESAQFSVEFSITEGATYQWQYLSGTEWKNTTVSGYNTNTITVAATSLALNGRQYRCVITYNGETYTSAAATLSITVEETEITTQPTDQSAISGDVVFFTFEDDSNGAATYRWLYKRPQNTSWSTTKLGGYATNTLRVPTYDFRDGYQYCCEITTTDGVNTYKTFTEEVTLHVSPVAVINQQPVDAKVDPNEYVTFTVDATPSGTTINYQWQYSKDGGVSWANTSMTGYNTNTLEVQALFARHGYKYRCRITNEFYGLGNGQGTGQVISDVATLRVNDPVTFKTQPADATVAAGETATFTVKTESVGAVTYWWQYSTDGGVTWKSTTMTGYNTATLSVTALAARNGWLYRCGVTNVRGVYFYSEPATLTVE